MHKRLISYLNKYNIITDKQHGFQKGKSTNSAIINLIKNVYSSMDKKEISLGIFLDLSKAFDLVDHDILYKKLYVYGVRGLALKWFKSYLTNRKQMVEITHKNEFTNETRNYLSKQQYVRYGVPQGSILGPTLFLIYINDLESHLKQVKPTFFADDTSVFISGHSIHSIQTEVDTTMNQLVEWFERNRLIINTQKTVAISFHHIQNNKHECPTINIGNKTITHTDSTKFLGLWLDQNLKWLTHIQILTRKLGKICFALRIVRQSLSLESVRSLYFAYFHSALMYGIIFWGNSPQAIQVFKLQKKAIRIMLQVSKRTSCRQLFKKLHILPLPSVYIYEVLVYMRANLDYYRTNAEVHSHNTRNKNNLSIIPHTTSLYSESFIYTGLRMYNALPGYLKEIPVLNFKCRLHKYLHHHSFYSTDEILYSLSNSNNML